MKLTIFKKMTFLGIEPTTYVWRTNTYPTELLTHDNN